MTTIDLALMPRLTIDELELLRDAPYADPITVRTQAATRLAELGLIDVNPCAGDHRRNVQVRCNERGIMAARPLSLAHAARIVATIEETRARDADEAAELARLLYHRVLLEGALMAGGSMGPYTYAKLVHLATSVSELVFLP